jgi:hypothetical protein
MIYEDYFAGNMKWICRSSRVYFKIVSGLQFGGTEEKQEWPV